MRPGSPAKGQNNYSVMEVEGIKVFFLADFHWPEDGVITIKLANYLLFKVLFVSPEASSIYR